MEKLTPTATLIVVSPSVTKLVTEIKAWFEECIIGQKDAAHRMTANKGNPAD